MLIHVLLNHVSTIFISWLVSQVVLYSIFAVGKVYKSYHSIANQYTLSALWLSHSFIQSCSQYLCSHQVVVMFLAQGYCGSCHPLSSFWVTIILGCIYHGSKEIFVHVLLDMSLNQFWKLFMFWFVRSIAIYQIISFGCHVSHLLSWFSWCTHQINVAQFVVWLSFTRATADILHDWLYVCAVVQSIGELEKLFENEIFVLLQSVATLDVPTSIQL